jgi:hypothetical protein
VRCAGSILGGVRSGSRSSSAGTRGGCGRPSPACTWDVDLVSRRGRVLLDLVLPVGHNRCVPDAYEYAVLIWVAETNWNKVRDLPEATRPSVTWTHRYELWLAGAENGLEMTPGSAGTVDILDRLGNRGWRLVEASILDTCVTGPLHGLPEVATPVKRQWTFMRERQA